MNFKEISEKIKSGKEFDETFPVQFKYEGICLSYNPERFEKECIYYILEQFENHKNFNELFRVKLLEIYDNFNKLNNSINNAYETICDIKPEDKKILKLVQIGLAPLSWIKFKTFNQELREIFEKYNDSLSKSEGVGFLVDYGRDFLEKRLISELGNSKEIKPILKNWFNVQEKLCFISSQTVSYKKKILDINTDFYSSLFPNFKNFQ